MPVWTSSNTSAAPTASHAARIDGQQLRRSITFTPDSPWIGSISTAAVFASTAAGDLVRRRRRGTRAPAARTAPAWPPAASPPARRRCGRGTRCGRRSTSPRGRALRTSLIAASLASAPGVAEEHDAAQRPRRTAAPPAHVGRRCRTGWRRGSAAPTCSCTAATTAGWQWPRLLTAIPLRKSRYSIALGVGQHSSRSRRRTRRGSARRSAPGVMKRASPSCRCRRP